MATSFEDLTKGEWKEIGVVDETLTVQRGLYYTIYIAQADTIPQNSSDKKECMTINTNDWFPLGKLTQNVYAWSNTDTYIKLQKD